MRFVAAVEAAVRRIAAHPGAGSQRYADPLRFPELRWWPLKRFPYLIFHVERETQIDIWRVLHSRRDIPAWLAGPES